MTSVSADVSRLSHARSLRRGSSPSLLLVWAVGFLLAIFAVGRVGRALGEMLQPGEATFGEAVLYDHAGRLLRGEPLYQPLDRPPYTVAAYTPLYYVLAAALQKVAGASFLPGRLLSFVAALVASFLVGLIAGRRARSRSAGLFAALLFLVLGFAGRVPWYAYYKEDMLGVALSLAAIALLAAGREPPKVAAAATLAALAILTKQTFVAAAGAGTLSLIPRNSRRGILFAGLCLAVVLATVVAFELTTGGAFLANTLSANAIPFRREAFLDNARVLARFQWVPFVLAALYVWDRARAREKPYTDLVILYWVLSFVPVVGMGKPGSNYNYWIEPAAATSVLATLAISERLESRTVAGRWRAALPILFLGAHVINVLGRFGTAALPIVSFRRAERTPAADFQALVARVRAEPREVISDPPDVVALAGRPNPIELYFSTIRQAKGLLDLSPLVRRICRGEVGLLVLRYSLDSEARGVYHGYAYWPADVLAALRERMVFQTKQAGRYLYVPAPPSVPLASASGGVCGREPAAR